MPATLDYSRAIKRDRSFKEDFMLLLFVMIGIAIGFGFAELRREGTFHSCVYAALAFLIFREGQRVFGSTASFTVFVHSLAVVSGCGLILWALTNHGEQENESD
jgi:hypothetical protein